MKYFTILSIEFLSEKYTQTSVDTPKNLSGTFRGLTQEEAEKQYEYGSIVGQIFATDDFDEPALPVTS